MAEGRVRALFVTPERKAKPVSLQSAVAAQGGFEGDYHSTKQTRRQILMVSGVVLDEFALQAGALFENVTIDGVDVMQLNEGQQLRLGDALVEVTVPCEPCIQMERVKQGLKEAVRDRRGMFVRVLLPGAVRVGDLVRVC